MAEHSDTPGGEITAIRLPTITELESAPESLTLWRDMTGEAREAMVCQVLRAWQESASWYGIRIPLEDTHYTQTLEGANRLLEWVHGEGFHSFEHAQAVELRMRHRIGPGLAWEEQLTVWHHLVCFTSPEWPSDLAYAFVAAYSERVGLSYPLYGDRWQKSFTREPILTETESPQSQGTHKIEEKV